MKILILEDDVNKLNSITDELRSYGIETEIVTCANFTDYTKEVNRSKFDLILTDLMVPRFKDAKEASDVSRSIIESVYDDKCKNYSVPVVAITGFNKVADDNIQDFNNYNIIVITYSKNENSWKQYLKQKVMTSLPDKTYFFAIVCALPKESDAYEFAGYKVGPSFVSRGINCKTISINNKNGIIITLTRMGLVNASITISRVIDIFKPKIICMSGICAGLKGKAKIYDVIIPQTCHQHDAGKWSKEGFVSEIYSVQLPHHVHLELTNIVDSSSFKESISKDIVLQKSEFPKGAQSLMFDVKLAPSSSGSSVVASEGMLDVIVDQHRKMTSFEMESYALYEAARQSLYSPIFFSAKSVVDNGDSGKTDHYQRVGALLSAKVVYEIISRFIEKKIAVVE